ncbi:hypothetical protein JCM10908_003965 [Rhodotorula pacifica]|uniref:GTPase-activating protein RGD2 n=1 Tax=Rhodotorula pacifica TaxID=1495444 RepID=UPI00316F389E
MAAEESTAVATITHKPVLPATFSNSFWSSDYRTGLKSLFTALDAATVQSEELVGHVQRRVELERTLAHGLVPPALRKDGFALDEGASLRIGFEALLTSSVSEARARQRLAEDLERTILIPFSSWSASHAARLSTSRTTLFTALDSYESQHALVVRLKLAYDTACRNADLAEDEYNFVAARDELGRAHVPPRPDELPDHPASPTTTVTTHSRDEDERPLGLRLRAGGGGQEDTAQAAKAIADDAAGEEDEGLIGRSGATGGSVLGALGRALTVRRRAGARRERKEEDGIDDDDDEQAAEGSGLQLPAGLHLPTIDANEVKAGLDWSKTKFSSLLSTVVGPQTGLERYEKTRKEADAAEEKYKREVVILDRLRLSLEETISTHLPYLQRCESDRLRAATSVLKSFHAAIAALPKLIDGSLERVGQALELCRPEKDLKAIIERRRTGPFQPSPLPFQSHYSDEPTTTFGIDLRKYDETNRNREQKPVPRVLELLLEWAEKKGKEASDDERRKAWLYDVPLASQHSLRSMLNPPALVAANNGAGPDLSIVDLPVLCATTKLWLLELEQPPFTWSAYEELRSAWATRTGANEGGGGGDENEETKVELLAKVVGKLPKIHFEVLRALITHLAALIRDTKTDEPLDIYLHKLSLSLARPLLRPKQTTSLSLDDRFPAAVISLLLSHTDEIFNKATEVAKREREDRYRPRRQRTKPVDERVRRSNLVGNGGAGGAGSPPPVPPRAGPFLTVSTGSQDVPDPANNVVVVSSPMDATQEELPIPPAAEKQSTQTPDEHAGDATPKAERAQAELPEPVPVVPSSPVEAPFEPPSPVEAPFVPPTSSSTTSPSNSASPTTSTTTTTTTEEKPLAASSSLKRSTGPGSGRLRGARGPRPPSQVLARVQALEGEKSSDGESGRTSSEQKRESWTRTREGPVEVTETD